jgi:hypothetical protein
MNMDMDAKQRFDARHQCNYCGKTLATPHRFITGEKGYEGLPHLKMTITYRGLKRKWIFCDFDCLDACLKKTIQPRDREGK